MPAKLHPHVQRAILRVRQAGGVVDPIADFPALVHLNDLAGRLDHPDVSDAITSLLAPVEVGGLMLHPLCLGAEEWLQAHAEWFPTYRLELLATAWCMAHPGRAYERLTSRVTTALILGAWQLTLLGVSWAALEMAVIDILKRGRRATDDGSASGDDEGPGLGAVLGMLCREYGKSPEYWLFDVPALEVKQLIDLDLIPRRNAEERAWRTDSGKVKAPDPRSYQVQAFHRFHKASEEWVRGKINPAPCPSSPAARQGDVAEALKGHAR